MSQSHISASFSISSGALCFGPIANILSGCQLPVQPPPHARPRLTGTVISHQLEYNVPAQTGKWNAYALGSTDHPRVAAWFAAHEGVVDPLAELHKIIRLAGSPYEYDHGHETNNEATEAEGVFLVNRYDWELSSDENEIPDGATEEAVMSSHHNIGLVDYAHAAEQAQEWAQERPALQRRSSHHGVWMDLPDAEYMWVRLGFDDKYTKARSLLYFSQATDFFTTKFPGQDDPLRRRETELARFHRGGREGRDYSGIARLREICTEAIRQHVLPGAPTQPPSASELIHQHNKDEHIFKSDDIEAVRASISPMPQSMEQEMRRLGSSSEAIEADKRRLATGMLAESHLEETLDLINELALSYLEHFVLPHRAHRPLSTLGPTLFPRHNLVGRAGSRHMDFHLMYYFVGTTSTLFPDLDGPSVRTRIHEFLDRRAGDVPVALDAPSLAGITRVVAFLVTEVLWVADKVAFGRLDGLDDGKQCIIVPQNIRTAVFWRDEIMPLVKYSAVYWYGRQ